ncbi:septation protein SepH [Pseudoclavibacter helvolus]|uniref:septation protein SepH n=1 Tax=Pseudoclavibacter helvolus TaxID=255205 RepID=UPI003C74A8DD
MQELRFIDLDEGALVVSGDDGQRFRVVIDEALRDALRPRISTRVDAPKVPPRAIQQLVRAGKSIDEVIELTGAAREDVVRFEGPVRAERDYVVRQSRAVTVRLKTESDPLGQDGTTFGEVIDDRLDSSAATSVIWDAWKDEEEGWRVGLSFAVDEIAREALWGFEPKTQALTPLNPTATTLSQQGEPTSLGSPRLRAVVETSKRETSPSAQGEPAAKEPVSWIGAAASRLERATEQQHHETADLLEALRRRRGERVPQSFEDEDNDTEEPQLEDGPSASADREPTPVKVLTPRSRDEDRFETETLEPSDLGTGGVRAVDVPLDGLDEPKQAPEESAHAKQSPKRSGRAAMPSWDEIVFGTRSDE